MIKEYNVKFKEIQEKWMLADKALLERWDDRLDGYGPRPGIEERMEVQQRRTELTAVALSLVLAQLVENENNIKSV